MAQQDMHDDPQQLELLRVARIGRAQGLKGEVTVRLYTDDPEWRFEPDSVLYSQDGETEYIVEGSRTFKDRWILKLEGVDDRNAAEAPKRCRTLRRGRRCGGHARGRRMVSQGSYWP